MNLRKALTLMSLVFLSCVPLGLVQAAPKEIAIENNEVGIGAEESKMWTIPPVNHSAKEHVLLTFEARMDANYGGGSMIFLDLVLNDRRITHTQSKPRLLNKENNFSGGLKWYEVGGGGWRVIYSRNYTSGLNAKDGPGPEAYRFVLDVTDLISKSKTNTLTINNLLTNSFRAAYLNNEDTKLMIRNIKIILVDEKDLAAFKVKPQSQQAAEQKTNLSVTKEEVGGETIYRFLPSDQELKIPIQSSAQWQWEGIPSENKKITLEFEARIDFTKIAGSMFYLEMLLNDKQITAAKDRQTRYLLNKPLTFKYILEQDELTLNWFDDATKLWRIIYAPDFVVADTDPGYVSAGLGHEVYRFVIDITRLVSAKPNTLVFKHQGTAVFQDYMGGAEIPIVLRNLLVRVSPLGDSDQDQKRQECLENKRKAQSGIGEYGVTVAQNGSLTINIGKERYLLNSRFSWPAQNGWNSLGSTGEKGESPETIWNPVVQQEGDNTWQVSAQGKYYSLNRRIEKQHDRILIYDTFTNLSDKSITGIMMKNSLKLFAMPSELYVGGNNDPTITSLYSPSNPTLFVPAGAWGIGIFLKDDVLRLQSKFYVDENNQEVGFEDNSFALAPGKSYTTEWVIYVGKQDYYAFVNNLRQELKTNFKIDGPYTFINPDEVLDMDKQVLKEKLELLGIKNVVFWGGWVDYKGRVPYIGFGVGTTSDAFAPYRARMKQAVQKLHEINPDLKVLAYFHFYLNSPEDQETAARFQDSWLITEDGNRAFVPGSKIWAGYEVAPQMFVYPTLDNTYGTALLQAADTLLAEVGVDGFYVDEMDAQVLGYAHKGYTFNRWDGHTAQIDPLSHEVTKTYGLVDLLSRDWKIKFIDQLREKGKVLLGNSEPTTTTLMSRQMVRFVETQVMAGETTMTHLYTPLAYVYPGNCDFPVVKRRLELGGLCFYVDLGTYKSTVIKRFFPIMPVEIHAGLIKGEERIITLLSGTYGWNLPEYEVNIYTFNKDGKEENIEQRKASGANISVNVPEGGLVVIEKK